MYKRQGANAGSNQTSDLWNPDFFWTDFWGNVDADRLYLHSPGDKADRGTGI